ncbi:hypothetical protein GCM10022420_061920 [Streptomyces iranensis]
MGDAEHCLDQSGDAGRALEVADVRLHRAYPQRGVRRPLPGQCGTERDRLDRIADPGAGAVRLHVLDVADRHPGPLVSAGQQRLLGRRARVGQALTVAVVVDGAAPDDAEHPVAVGYRRAQPFEDDQTGTLASDESVGPLVEGVTAAVG